VVVITSCTKQESQITYQSGTPPVLTSSLSDTIPLVPATKNQPAITFSWTNPNYVFTDGISSQDVSYYVEFDTVGANFTSPNMQQFSVSGSLSTTFTQDALNNILSKANALNLAYGIPHNVQVRLVSFLGNYQLPLMSKSMNFVVTPFAPPPAVTPPSTGKLFIVGSAVAGGWGNPIGAGTIAAQTFTQVNTTDYTITLSIIGGMEFKLIDASDGTWKDQWSTGVTDAPLSVTNNNLTYTNVFQSQGQNSIAPPLSGTYSFEVNFQTGKYTFIKQ
jgi:hypothetical protein